jgi:hypothetical protein
MDAVLERVPKEHKDTKHPSIGSQLCILRLVELEIPPSSGTQYLVGLLVWIHGGK